MGVLLHAGADHGRCSQTRHASGRSPVHFQIAGHNAFAVKFIRLDEDTRSRIGRAIDRQFDRLAEDGATAINAEANDD